MTAKSSVLYVTHGPPDPHSAVFGHIQKRRAWLEAEGFATAAWTPADFPELSTRAHRWWPWVWPPLLRQAIDRSQFDLVIHHSWTGAAASLRGIPIVQFHGLEPLYYRAAARTQSDLGTPFRLRYRLAQQYLLPRVLRKSCRNARLVLCLNEEERREITRQNWADAGRIEILPHAIEDSFFDPCRDRAQVRRIAFVGQWLEMKGIRELTEAFSRLGEDRADLHFDLAGVRSPSQEVLASFPESMKQRVRVLPSLDRDQLRDVLRACDLFVFPSHWEAWGMAPAEACAAGAPLVATEVGFIADHLTPGRDYERIPARNAAALTGTLRRLLNEPGRLTQLGRSGQTAVQGFRESEVRPLYVRRIREMLASG